MKKIIIIIVILAALGGGGYFGYTKFVKKPETAELTENHAPEKPESEVAEYPTEPAKIPLSPITISIYKDGEIKKLYGIHFSLDLYDEKLLEKAEKLTPKLRDEVIKYLLKLSKSAPHLLMDEKFVRQKILHLTEPVLTAYLETDQPAITGVYIHDIGLRKSVR